MRVRLAHADYALADSYSIGQTAVCAPRSYCMVCWCSNLYDVFVNIRDDELEHVKTMVACEDNSISVDIMVSRCFLATSLQS